MQGTHFQCRLLLGNAAVVGDRIAIDIGMAQKSLEGDVECMQQDDGGSVYLRLSTHGEEAAARAAPR